MILAGFLTKSKIIAIACAIAIAGSFYLGMSYTQGKWDRAKALDLASAKKRLESSLVQSYGIGKVFEESQRATQENHEQIQKGIAQFVDPCGYSTDWWLLHDAAALNRATTFKSNAGSSTGP